MSHFTPRRIEAEPQRLGASWYPEHWPETAWSDDVDRMAELGFDVVRLFEFAWSRFEPVEGRLDTDWALRVMDLCHARGISVIAGTPTAAPPAWLTSAYPDVLHIRPDGKPAGHGKRKHFSHISPRYREHCRRIVSGMAKALAAHPALLAWQIDNEMSGQDYSSAARASFQEWLQRLFSNDIEALNAAWGMQIWSQTYSSFEQIPLPTVQVGSIEIPERHHPSLLIAMMRWNNECWYEYILNQVNAIRAASSHPITTNMTQSWTMDWHRHNQPLDRVGYSVYADLEHYHYTLERFERMRPEKPAPYWLLETAPNWSGGGRQWNIHHSNAGVRAITWLSAALGGSMTVYWQWREHWAGPESHHGTCRTATGRWRPGRPAWEQLARELKAQSDFLAAHPPAQGDLAIVQCAPSAWSFSIDPLTDDMRYGEIWRAEAYLPLVRRHLWRDVIGDRAPIDGYKVLLLPFLPMVPEQLMARLETWVRAGGRLLIGPLTGTRTGHYTVPLDHEFCGLESLMGAQSSTRFTAMWIENTINVDFGDGKVVRPTGWCEGFEPGPGCEVLAAYRGGWGDGQAAVLRHRVGEGEVLTLGCRAGAEVYGRLVGELARSAGVQPLARGSGSVVVSPRVDAAGRLAAWAVVNITELPQSISLPTGGRDRLTGRTVPAEIELAPLEVLLIEPAA